MIKIEIEKKLYGSQGDMVLSVDLNIQKGEFVALMGESGAGKTTLLRVLAGLESMDGEIAVEGRSWKNVAPQQREIGFVFQDYALFENMTVEENLLFVNPDKKLASELLALIELSALKSRNVSGLSGGQKQRVALGRALMKKPKILLMDEPFSALDQSMRSVLQSEIKKLHEHFGMTTIMVSHDVSEIFTVASRVLVLGQGSIVKDGTIEEVLLHNIYNHRTEVLSLKEKVNKIVATVSVMGRLIEVDVGEETKLGETIEVILQGVSQ